MCVLGCGCGILFFSFSYVLFLFLFPRCYGSRSPELEARAVVAEWHGALVLRFGIAPTRVKQYTLRGVELVNFGQAKKLSVRIGVEQPVVLLLLRVVFGTLCSSGCCVCVLFSGARGGVGRAATF